MDHAAALRACADLVAGEFDDWFLPTAGEFYILWRVRPELLGLERDPEAYHWTAARGDASDRFVSGWRGRSGEWLGSYKSPPSDGIRKVRCMRKF